MRRTELAHPGLLPAREVTQVATICGANVSLVSVVSSDGATISVTVSIPAHVVR